MKIKALRIYKGYTQEDMSKLLNISLSGYQKIEKGLVLPNIYIGLKICKLLDVDPFELWNIN